MTAARRNFPQPTSRTPFAVEITVQQVDRNSAWTELWHRIFATLPDLNSTPILGQGSEEEAA